MGPAGTPPSRRMTLRPRPRLRLAAGVALLGLLSTRAAAQAPASRAAEPISRELAVATFDSAWGRIGATHYDTLMGGVDWTAVRDSLRPRAAEARTLGALRVTIAAMLGTLRESHFVLIPQEAADAIDPDGGRVGAVGGAPGDVGIELRLLADTVVVSRVRSGSAAERAGVRPGWILDSVGRFSAVRARATMGAGELPRRQLVAMIPGSAAAQFAGEAGTPVHAVFTDARGRTRALRMIREPLRGTPIRFGNLPTMFVEVEHEARPLAGGGCAGIIRFNAWMLPAAARLDSAVDAVRHCDGVVVDIRGNPGGIGAMVMGFGGHFLDSAAALGVLRTRANTLRFVANPRRADMGHRPVRPFAGPLAIVVDSLSMSTSEIFAAGMQMTGRARLFGENTPGLALPAVVTRLPTGDAMMHVFADFTDPRGTRIEGRGAVPDVLVPLTRADLLAGRDAPVDSALAWIAAGRRPAAAAAAGTNVTGAAAP